MSDRVDTPGVDERFVTGPKVCAAANSRNSANRSRLTREVVATVLNADLVMARASARPTRAPKGCPETRSTGTASPEGPDGQDGGRIMCSHLLVVKTPCKPSVTLVASRRCLRPSI